MSADAWRICPKCKRGAESKQTALQHALRDAYGKVSLEEFDRLTIEAERPLNLKETFREDYEISTDSDGEFMVAYEGACTVCGFCKTFMHKEQLLYGEAVAG